MYKYSAFVTCSPDDLLPITYYPLPITHYLLPITYYPDKRTNVLHK
ncbi:MULTISPECIES: hypothetical protein [Moorena]|nr:MULTISPECIES: hypothetical protein [Moorena]NEP34829.1 hypothetical protein [Moorena sp. SIO3B2]NEP66174.1 hypothetical protein [Moorena sp. SIO3A5]NER89313.1 hypothetical protein [Moorena sp. SIO3A2]